MMQFSPNLQFFFLMSSLSSSFEQYCEYFVSSDQNLFIRKCSTLFKTNEFIDRFLCSTKVNQGVAVKSTKQCFHLCIQNQSFCLRFSTNSIITGKHFAIHFHSHRTMFTATLARMCVYDNCSQFIRDDCSVQAMDQDHLREVSSFGSVSLLVRH